MNNLSSSVHVADRPRHKKYFYFLDTLTIMCYNLIRKVVEKMILTILLVGIILLVISLWLGSKKEWIEESAWIGLFVLGTLIILVSGIWSLAQFYEIKQIEHTNEQRIKLYEDYNAEIKLQVDAVALQYLDHESEIYEQFNSTEILLIVPELNSNTVIMEQIALYEENELKLLELREQKINLSFMKFILYWGG